jgi:hypothetical protein
LSITTVVMLFVSTVVVMATTTAVIFIMTVLVMAKLSKLIPIRMPEERYRVCMF